MLQQQHQMNQGTTLIMKYKPADFPYGVAYLIIKSLRMNHTLKDATAKIEMEAELG